MNLTTFNFNNMAVRAITDDQGNPWFVASDVCKVLEIGNVSQAMTRLDDDEKDITTTDTRGGKQDMTIVNESGLYSLIMKSRKPEAKSFQKWVTSEVLPSIRKTGGYSVQQPQPTKISFNEAAAGLDIIYRSLNVSESGKLSLFRGLAEDYGVSTNRLPSYTIDSQTVAAGSSEPTLSITEILKRGRVNISPVAANKKLQQLGLIRQETRPSSTHGSGVKNFWTVTDVGLKYGKNVTSDRNQLETQPHWYITTMDELLGLLSE